MATTKLYYAADPKGKPIGGTNSEHRHMAVQALGKYMLPHHFVASAYDLNHVGEIACRNGYAVHEIEVEVKPKEETE